MRGLGLDPPGPGGFRPEPWGSIRLMPPICESDHLMASTQGRPSHGMSFSQIWST